MHQSAFNSPKYTKEPYSPDLSRYRGEVLSRYSHLLENTNQPLDFMQAVTRIAEQNNVIVSQDENVTLVEPIDTSKAEFRAQSTVQLTIIDKIVPQIIAADPSGRGQLFADTIMQITNEWITKCLLNQY